MPSPWRMAKHISMLKALRSPAIKTPVLHQFSISQSYLTMTPVFATQSTYLYLSVWENKVQIILKLKT